MILQVYEIMTDSFGFTNPKKKCDWLIALIVFSTVCSIASAQYSYFGKNKVQTRDYEFRSFQTEHFNILFYPGGEVLAEFAARVAEEYYRQFEQDLGFGLEYKIPLILYLSPAQFSETNVITDIIEEGVGGFSELFKNRVVVPFDGSYFNLRRVLAHELTHLFEFQMFYRSRLAALLGAIGEFQIPLWVLEGFAEFQSGWANVRSEVFMRDLVLSNRLVPLQNLHDGMGYLVYRVGQSFFEFVAERYGRDKVFEFMHTLKNKRNLEATFKATFGKEVSRMSEEWEKWLRIKYWPQVVKVMNFDTLCRKLTDHRRDGSIYNTAPRISPSGTKIAMISDRLEYADCYVISALDGTVLKRLVKGGRSGGFETMHLLRPGLAWSPDEQTLAVVTQSAGRDNIALVDYATGRVRRRLAFGLDAIFTPVFSPDGKKLAFVGLKNGFADIYEVAVAGGDPRRVTYDMYDDRDPTYSPGGETLAFVSDRPDAGEEYQPGRYAVWLHAGGGAVHRITERYEDAGYPVFTHSGEYLFYVAFDSARNIYCYSFAAGRPVRRTDLLGEVSYLSLSRDDRKLAFSYYADVGFDIAVILEPLERIPYDTIVPTAEERDTFRFSRRGLDFERVKPAGFSLSADYAVGTVSYTSSSGVSGTVNIALSDMLGNHRFEIFTDVYGDILNSNLIVQYWLLPFRVDYGFALFQLYDIPYFNYVDLLVERINRGGQAVAVYPFDFFTRAELGLTGYASDVQVWKFFPYPFDGWQRVDRWLEAVFYASPALVFDNTFWDQYGPARGVRCRFGADLALPMVSDRQFQSPYLDARNYQRLGRRFVFASRLYGVASLGRDADQYYLGGETVRGYNWGEFYDDTGSYAGLAGIELRYPFLDKLKLAFPLPLEIGGIRGVAFLDGGMVFRRGMRVWDPRRNQLQDLKLGIGTGLRIQVTSLFIKLDFAKPLSATQDKGWKVILGLGTDY